MSKRPCPVPRRPVADPSPTVHPDPAWRALYAAYRQWFEREREAKQKRFQRMISAHRGSPLDR